jgi:methionyl-tRNA synthetase
VAEGHPDEKEDKALIRKMVKQQALKKENMLAREQHEDHEISMATSELKNVYINAKKLFDIIKQRSEQEGLDAWQQSKITKASDYLNSVLTAIRGEPRR